MIRSRRNERTRRRTKIRRRSDNFRSWTKGFVRKKRSREEEDKFLKKQKKNKKKTKGRRRTQQNRVYAQLKQQPAECQHSRRLLTQLPITPSLSAVASSSFFYFFFSSFFFPLMELCNFPFFSKLRYVFLFLSLDFCYFFTPLEFLSPCTSRG